MAILVECGAVQIVVQIGNPTAGDAIGESRDAAAAPVNRLLPLPTDDKIGAEIQPGVGADIRGSGVGSKESFNS